MIKQFNRLVEIIAKLRSEEGCPWDKEQTFVSLKPCLIEEANEVLETIDQGDWDNLKEELGDLLIQVGLYVQLASEKGFFGMEEVLEGACEKLIRRHPHVFGEVKLKNSQEVIIQWQEIKRKEKEGKIPSGGVAKR